MHLDPSAEDFSVFWLSLTLLKVETVGFILFSFTAYSIRCHLFNMLVELLDYTTRASDFSEALRSSRGAFFWAIITAQMDRGFDHVAIKGFGVDNVDTVLEASLILQIIVNHWAIVANEIDWWSEGYTFILLSGWLSLLLMGSLRVLEFEAVQHVLELGKGRWWYLIFPSGFLHNRHNYTSASFNNSLSIFHIYHK